MQQASLIFGKASAASKRSKEADPLLDAEQIACAAWARAVGKTIAQHTRAAKLVRGRLVVEVEDATWQRNLFTLTRHVLANLEKALGPGMVGEIEFRIAPPRREPQRAAESQAALSGARDESDAIGDPGMRRLYRAARLKESA